MLESDTIKKVKRKPKKIHANYISNKGFVSRIKNSNLIMKR